MGVMSVQNLIAIRGEWQKSKLALAAIDISEQSKAIETRRKILLRCPSPFVEEEEKRKEAKERGKRGKRGKGKREKMREEIRNSSNSLEKRISKSSDLSSKDDERR